MLRGDLFGFGKQLIGRNCSRQENGKHGSVLRHAVFARRLRCEPLEDRRMLSITLFVDADAVPSGDGLAWGTAYDDLQAALTQAAAINADNDQGNNVDAVWIAKGTYKPSAELEPGDARSASFSLLDGVALLGGFDGTETALDQRDIAVNTTTLSGDLGPTSDSSDNAYTVVFCDTNIEATLDALTIADGNASGYSSSHPERDKGGGIYINGGALTVIDSTVSGNSAIGDYSSGGGIYNNGGALTVIDSTVSSNSVIGVRCRGGGIFNYEGTLTVANSTISGNSANGTYGDGGGMCIDGDLSTATLTVTNSMLSGNSATGNYSRGGGIFNNSTLRVTNSTVSGNSVVGDSSSGGGIYNNSTLTVINSTLSGNSADYGGGIFNVGNPSIATLGNTIVAGNTALNGPDIYHVSGTITGSYNLIGDGTGQSSLVNDTIGNIVGTAGTPINPELSDWTQLDNGQWGYYLLPGSPALDAGDVNLAVDAAGQPLTVDMLGNTRVQNAQVDIGSVEGATVGTLPQTYIVTSLENTVAADGLLTFIEAFEAANSNQSVGDAPAGSFAEQDVIRFTDGLSGTVTLDDGQLLILGDLNIEGPGTALLTFNAGNNSHVFRVSVGVLAALSGMTVTGGSADNGGGIWNDYGTLTVTNSTISTDGRGIYNYRGTLTLTNSIISANACGGIFNSSGILTVTNSTISGNSFAGYRGGGGIYNFHGTLTVSNSTLSGNVNHYDGGGIYNDYGMLTVTNSIISGNSVMGDHNGAFGGGIYNCEGVLMLTNSTLSGNSADYGGGIYNFGSSSTATLRNTIIAGNTAYHGPDIYRKSGMLSGTHNLIGDGTGQTSLIHNTNGNLVGTTAATIDPMFVDPAGGDLQLLPGSAAIDAGDNSLAVDSNGNSLPTDLDGNYRIANSTVDIGAYEFGSTPLVPGDANLDGIVDDVDSFVVSGNWQKQSGAAWSDGDFNYDGRVDDIDATLMAANWQRKVSPPATSALVAVEPETMPYDLDRDGVVGLGDLAVFASVYGEQPGVTTESPDVYVADFDGSGTVDLGDLAIFSAAYRLGRSTDSTAGSPEVTQSASSAQQTALTAAAVPALLPGDANRDGTVDDDDATALAANWQKQSAATWSEGDFNGDGQVSDADVSILAQHWMVTAEDFLNDDDEQDAVYAAIGARDDALGLLD